MIGHFKSQLLKMLMKWSNQNLGNQGQRFDIKMHHNSLYDVINN